MRLAASSFYHKPKGDTEKDLEDADLRDKIEAIYLEFPRYGYRRVTAALQQQDVRVNHKRVLRIMRQSDLPCRIKKRWVKTTDSRHCFPRHPNLIKRLVISHSSKATCSWCHSSL